MGNPHRTYEKKLGWVNVDEKIGTDKKTGEEIPLVYGGGHCWLTKGGVACMIPDQFLDTATEEQRLNEFLPLPEGIMAVKYPLDDTEVFEVTYDN